MLKVQYLNEYVFWAYCHLLKKREIQDKINDSEEMSFSDILSELYPDGSLLIIEKGKMPEGKTEKSYELSLASNGYFKKQVNYRNPKIKSKSNNKLKLTSASEILNADGSYMNTYINEFLTKHVYNENSFIRFFYLYQIVEILLDAEMVELLRDYAKKIENNEVTFRTAENGLQKNTESERFKKIVERAGLFNKEIYDYNVFDNVCVKFVGLEEEKKEKEKEIKKGTKGVNVDKFKHPEIIYQVRNHIVHRFRKAIADEDTVKDICDHLELYLYDLLIAYKKPDANS